MRKRLHEERLIERVSYAEEFQLAQDDSELYHLLNLHEANVSRSCPLIAVDRHGRRKEIPWGTKVLVLSKR